MWLLKTLENPVFMYGNGCISYPPCRFLRKFTFEGAAVSGGRLLEIYTAPPLRQKSTKSTVICTVLVNFYGTINIYTPDTCPRSWSCCHGSSYTAPASSLHPRTICHLHGAAQYDPPQLPSPIFPVSGTGHTADVFSGTCSLPCATGCHTRARKEMSCHCDAVLHVPHNISRPSVSGIPDAYMVSSAFSASHHFLTPP